MSTSMEGYRLSLPEDGRFLDIVLSNELWEKLRGYRWREFLIVSGLQQKFGFHGFVPLEGGDDRFGFNSAVMTGRIGDCYGFRFLLDHDLVAQDLDMSQSWILAPSATLQVLLLALNQEVERPDQPLWIEHLMTGTGEGEGAFHVRFSPTMSDWLHGIGPIARWEPVANAVALANTLLLPQNWHIENWHVGVPVDLPPTFHVSIADSGGLYLGQPHTPGQEIELEPCDVSIYDQLPLLCGIAKMSDLFVARTKQ